MESSDGILPSSNEPFTTASATPATGGSIPRLRGHHSVAATPNARLPISTDATDGGTSHSRPPKKQDIQHIVEELQRSNERLKAAIDESRRAVRDVCADVFVLRNQLDVENAYQTAVSNTISSAVGVEGMQDIERLVAMGEQEESDAHLNIAHRGRKRRRSSTPYHVMTVDYPHRDKRRRLNDAASSPTHQHVAPRTILNYPSDEDDTDDTYSDSNGTERDFVDDPYLFYDSRGYNPHTALEAWNYDREWSGSDEDGTDISGPGIPWDTIAEFDDDSSDPDYEPPDWDLEDVWELENPPDSSRWKLHSLYLLNFGDEINDCDGFLSDSDLSSDDSEKGHHHLSIIQRPSKSTFLSEKKSHFSASLGPLLTYNPKDWESQILPWEIDDETLERARESKLFHQRHDAWLLVRLRLEKNMFPPLDIEQRLEDWLKSDHARFYFDDEEWRCFEE